MEPAKTSLVPLPREDAALSRAFQGLMEISSALTTTATSMLAENSGAGAAPRAMAPPRVTVYTGKGCGHHQDRQARGLFLGGGFQEGVPSRME